MSRWVVDTGPLIFLAKEALGFWASKGLIHSILEAAGED